MRPLRQQPVGRVLAWGAGVALLLAVLVWTLSALTMRGSARAAQQMQAFDAVSQACRTYIRDVLHVPGGPSLHQQAMSSGILQEGDGHFTVTDGWPSSSGVRRYTCTVGATGAGVRVLAVQWR